MLKADLSNLDDVLAKYDVKLSKWKNDVSLEGRNLERANMEQPAYSAYYDQIRAELESLMNKVEFEVKVTRAKAMERITDQASKAHGERTLEKFAEADPICVKKHKAYLEIVERYLEAKTAVDAFKTRGFALNNIVKVRLASLQDITIYESD